MSVKGSAALASMIKKKSNLLYGEGEGSPIEGTFGQSPTSSPFKAAPEPGAPEPTAPETPAPEPVSSEPVAPESVNSEPQSNSASEAAPEPAPAAETAAPAPPQPSAPSVAQRAGSFYKPTVTQFSGASKCALCEKTVYKNEEIIAIGKTWHNTCFKCGGQAGDGCGRTLRRDNYSDHNCQPYCNACSSKLFKPQGFGYSGALHLNSGKVEQPATTAATSQAAPSAAVPATAAPAAPAAAPTEAKANRTSPDSGAAGPVPTPPKPLLNEIKAAAQTKEELKPVKYSSNTVKMAFAAVPKCTVCNKSVYKVEEMNAVGRVWHLSCFRCGGTGNEGGCGKVLKRDNYVDHEHNPYCVPCHGKLFRLFGAKDPAVLASTSRDSADGNRSRGISIDDHSQSGNGHGQVPSANNGSTDTTGIAADLSKVGVAEKAADSPPSVAATGAALNIGGSSRSAGGVFKEASYVGNHDEVAEEEWN